jgi:hypothetical protein
MEAARSSEFCYPPTKLRSVTFQNPKVSTFRTPFLLTQDRIQWQAVQITVMNLPFHKGGGIYCLSVC